MVENQAKDANSPEKRRLFDHEINKFNRDCIFVYTEDDPGSDGARHEYLVHAYTQPVEGEAGHITEACRIRFQNGSLKDVGTNGITDEALLAIVLDRLRSFNEGRFRCRQNSLAITHLEEALHWLEARSKERSRRGVFGERQV